MEVHVVEKVREVTIDSLKNGDVFVFGFEPIQRDENIKRRVYMKAAWTNFANPNVFWNTPQKFHMCLDLKDGTLMELPANTLVMKATQAKVDVVI